MVSLLPEPAPATTTEGPSGAAITRACSGVGSGRPSIRAISAGVSTRRGRAPSPAPHAARSVTCSSFAPYAPRRPLPVLRAAGPAPADDPAGRPRLRGSTRPPAPAPVAPHGRSQPPPLVVGGAAGADRAAAAPVVAGGGEPGAGHALGGLQDEPAGPLRVRVGAEGALLLLLGVLQRPADLDQRRPARLGEPEAGEGALEHGELVDAELREAAQLVLAGHA